jgi:signal transduction histidine kinase
MLVHVIRAPLAQLNRGTKSITDGDLTYRIDQASNDEFGDLATQYNRMVEQLQATTVSRDRLEESEGKLQKTVTELRHEIAERGRAEREREHLQAELRRSETMSAMGALVAGVAHEVRNPLFGISSTLDAMSARLGEQTEYRRYLDVLQTEVRRLSKLMADLLSYGKPPTREFVVGSLNAVAALAVEACGDLARKVDATIVNQVGPEPIAVRLDQGRLMQAFQNLIDNALQHAPPQTAVTVAATRIEEHGRRWIACAVSDSGPGFQSEDLPRIFEPFVTRRRGGTGLGLALVQRIVHEHGGQIMAQNRPEGGAVVIVRFPVAEL